MFGLAVPGTVVTNVRPNGSAADERVTVVGFLACRDLAVGDFGIHGLTAAEGRRRSGFKVQFRHIQTFSLRETGFIPTNLVGIK